MKTYEIQKYGGPEGLELVDRPLPEPGDHDVVVQIRAASLNYRDLVVIRGKYDRNPREGRVPLSTALGKSFRLVRGSRGSKSVIESPAASSRGGPPDDSKPPCIERRWGGRLTVFWRNR